MNTLHDQSLNRDDERINPNIAHASDFQSVLNYLVNFSNNKRPDKKRLAAEMELKVDTLQRHCNGTIRTDADFARNIIRASAAISPALTLELARFFLPPGYQLIREDDIATSGGEAKLVDLSVYVGKIQEAVSRAYKDGRVTKTELREIERLTAELNRTSTEIKERTRRDAR